MPSRDAAIQVIVQQAKGGLTDRLLYVGRGGFFDTGRVELHPGIQLSHCVENTAWSLTDQLRFQVKMCMATR